MNGIELVIRGPGSVERHHPLGEGTVSLGRAETNDIVLPDIAVSRKHARIHVEKGQVVIEDVGSGNGTYYQGKRITRKRLEDGDEITIEPFTLRFVIPESPARKPTPPPARRGARLVVGGPRPDRPSRSRVQARPVLPGSLRAHLEVLSGKGIEATRVELGVQGLTIGRAEERDLVLPDPAASRRHAVIVLEGDGWLLRDLGSANGTYVNGRRVREHELQDGDRIRIGETELLFVLEATAEAGEHAAPLPETSEGTHGFGGWMFGGKDRGPGEREPSPKRGPAPRDSKERAVPPPPRLSPLEGEAVEQPGRPAPPARAEKARSGKAGRGTSSRQKEAPAQPPRLVVGGGAGRKSRPQARSGRTETPPRVGGGAPPPPARPAPPAAPAVAGGRSGSPPEPPARSSAKVPGPPPPPPEPPGERSPSPASPARPAARREQPPAPAPSAPAPAPAEQVAGTAPPSAGEQPPAPAPSAPPPAKEGGVAVSPVAPPPLAPPSFAPPPRAAGAGAPPTVASPPPAVPAAPPTVASPPPAVPAAPPTVASPPPPSPGGQPFRSSGTAPLPVGGTGLGVAGGGTAPVPPLSPPPLAPAPGTPEDPSEATQAFGPGFAPPPLPQGPPPAVPVQGQGFGAPAQGFGASAQGFGAPAQGFGAVELDMAPEKGRGSRRKMKRMRSKSGPVQGTWMQRNIRKLTLGIGLFAVLMVVVKAMRDSGGPPPPPTPSVQSKTKTAGTVAGAAGTQVDGALLSSMKQQAMAYFREGRFKEAIGKYAEIQKLDPLDVESAAMGYLSCELYVLYRMADEVKNRAASEDEKQKARKDALDLASRAIEHRNLRELREAVKAIDAISGSFPGDRELADKRKEAQRIIRLIGRTIAENQQQSLEDSERDLYEKASSYASRGNYDKAIATYQKVIAGDPERKTSYPYQAEEQIRRIQAELQKRASPYYKKGVEAARSQQYLSARAYFKKALEIYPAYPGAQQRLDQVQAKLDQAAQQLWAEAEIYEKTNQLELAIGRYRKVIQYCASPSTPLARKAQAKIDALMR